MTPPTYADKFIEKKKEKIKSAANSFYTNIQKPYRPTLAQVMEFEMSKALYRDGEAAKVSPADHLFYKDRDFYVPMRIAAYKKFPCRALSVVLVWTIKKIREID